MVAKLWSLQSRSLRNVSKNGRQFFRQARNVQTASATANPDEDRKNWVCSKYEIETVKGLLLPEFFKETMGKWGSAPAFECGETGRVLTHNEVISQSRGFAAALMQAGYKRGDVIAVVLSNSPEYCSVLLGIWEAGLTASTVNPAYTVAEMKRQVGVCGASGIVTSTEYLTSCREVKSGSPSLRSLILIGEPHEGCHTYSEMVKTSTIGVNFATARGIDTTEEVAILPFSSGTTGPPKGVMLTHSSVATNLVQLSHPSYTTLRAFEDGNHQERFLGLLPFFHSYGMVCLMLTGLYKGFNTMTLPRFETGLFLKAMRKHKPTTLHTVTPILSYMVNSEDYTAKEFEETKVIIGGAAPIGATLIHQVMDKAGKHLTFQEGYGMTELSPVSHMLAFWTNNQKSGSCGQPVPSTMTKVVDPTTGRALPRNEKGEVCVKGPQVMKGYYNNEKATRETIDEEGWLHTGDIGYYDDEGFLYIVDRMKELIKVKGLQVSPSELEDLLRDMPKVEDVAVIGVPHDQWGEAPRAYIIPKKNSNLKDQEVHDYLQNLVSKHKYLNGGIELVKTIPKLPSGKILRRELLDEYKQKFGIV